MKRALSILLAMLMLVSLCGSLSFADDDIVEEETAAEENTVIDEYVEPEDEYVEAADAYVEEYTDEEEGSFEAADAFTPSDIHDRILAGYVIDGIWEVTEDPDTGRLVIGKFLGIEEKNLPTKHEAKALVKLKKDLGEDPADPSRRIYGNPEEYYMVVPHIWSDWVVVYDDKASCEEDGWQHKERTCIGEAPYTGWHKGCGKVEKTEKTFVPRTEHYFVQDETYTAATIWEQYGVHIDCDDRAIVKKPTCKADGLGHWVCKNCGAPAPDKFWNRFHRVLDEDGVWTGAYEAAWEDGDYVIERQYEWVVNPDTQEGRWVILPRYHDFGAWTTIKPAYCLVDGTEAHYCSICKFQQTRDIPAFLHGAEEEIDWTEGECSILDWPDDMVFKGIERLDCWHYVEVWECSNPACHTRVNPNTGVPEYTSSNSQFTVYVYKYEGLTVYFETLKENLPATDGTIDGYADTTAFLYTHEYLAPFNNNTEFYPHHRYTTEWEMRDGDQPKCCVPGRWTRVCADCTYEDYKPEPALEPIFGDEIHTAYWGLWDVDGDQEIDDPIYIHWVTCTRRACQEDIFGDDYHDEDADPAVMPVFDKIPGITPNDKRYFTQANNSNPQVYVVDHDWTEWVCYVAPVEGVTDGHWTRTCKYMDPAHLPEGEVCDGCDHPCLQNDEFVGTQAEFDAMTSHPVLKSGLIPEIVDGVVVYKLYDMGIFQEDETGIVQTTCEGVVAEYYVKDGIWQKEENGATLVGDVWYFLANGKVQRVSQMCEYQEEWFYVDNGVIDTKKNGLVDYNGGTFMLGVGRIQKEVDGLWENSKLIGGDGNWYYLAMGQVQKGYTGLVEYDGEWFYVEKGMLVPINGIVEYDGHFFKVENGQMVAQVA